MIIESKELYEKHLPSDLPLYFQLNFLEAVDKEWTAIVSKADDGEVEWLLPFKKRSKYGFKLYGPVKLAHDNAVLVILEKEKMTHAPNEISSLGRIFISDRETRITNRKLLRNASVIYRNRQYFDLKSFPTDLMGLKKRKRSNIRKAQSCRISLSDDVSRFYQLYSSTFSRRDLKEWSLKRFERIYNKLNDFYENKIFILTDQDGKDLACNWVVGYEDSIYGLMRAKNYEINQRGSQEYMIWSVIQLMRNDYYYWDLGGSNIPGVKNFNLEMGAENIEYPSYEIYKPLWVEKIIKLLPQSLLSGISR